MNHEIGSTQNIQTENKKYMHYIRYCVIWYILITVPQKAAYCTTPQPSRM